MRIRWVSHPATRPDKGSGLSIACDGSAVQHASQRYVRTWKVLRGPDFPLDEARDLGRGAQTFAAARTQRAWHGK